MAFGSGVVPPRQAYWPSSSPSLDGYKGVSKVNNAANSHDRNAMVLDTNQF